MSLMVAFTFQNWTLWYLILSIPDLYLLHYFSHVVPVPINRVFVVMNSLKKLIWENPVKYVLKRVSFGSKECTKEL